MDTNNDRARQIGELDVRKATRLSVTAFACFVASGWLATVHPGMAFAAGPDAEADSSDSGGLQEVLVTATRRSENLQKVPIAITSLSAADLDKSRLSDMGQVALSTPGLNWTERGAGVNPYLRGVGTADSTQGGESPVAVYVDGIYQATMFGANPSLNNVDRVEVLKGPQGTLFGRNATGGLINIITKTPSQKASLSAAVSYGNFDTVATKMYGTMGVTDTIAADVAVYYTNQGRGFGHNAITGSEINMLQDLSLRSKWLYTPTDNIRVTLTGAFDHKINDTDFLTSVVPGTRDFANEAALPNFYDTRATVDPYFHYTAASTSLRYEQDVNPIVTVTSTSSFTHVNYDLWLDNDFSGIPLVNVVVKDAPSHTFIQEFQFTSGPSSPFKWVGGLFYYSDRQAYAGPRGLHYDGLAFGDTGGANVKAGVTAKSYAAYGEATFQILPKLEATAGARWTRDEKELFGRTEVLNSDGSVLVTIPYNLSPMQRTFTEPTWRGILNYSLTDMNSIYGSVSKGFKSGGFNSINPANPAYDPETLIAYEVGSKNELLGRRLTLNVSAFYYDYKNLQFPAEFQAATLIVNAGKAKIKGGEVEIHAVPVDGLNISAGYSYLDGEYTQFPNSPCNIPLPNGGNNTQTCDVRGHAIMRSPKNMLNIGANTSIPIAVGSIEASALWYHNSGFFWEPDSRLRQRAYSLLNATLGWTNPSKVFTAMIYGKNLTNTQYASQSLSQSLGDSYVPGNPRTYGLELRVNF